MKYLIRKNMRFGTTRIICQDKETANIFLAAPEMYEALKAFDEYVSANFPSSIRLKQIAVEQMEQALIKAEGK